MSCVTRQVLFAVRDVRPDQPEALRFRPPVARLRGEVDLDFSLVVSYTYQASTRNSGADVDVRLMDYFYDFRVSEGTELIAFHWHPGRDGQPDFPHLHVTSRPGPVRIQRKHHVPTDRVSLESVVRFAIQDLGVRPLRPDWEQVLDAGQADFDARRSW